MTNQNPQVIPMVKEIDHEVGAEVHVENDGDNGTIRAALGAMLQTQAKLGVNTAQKRKLEALEETLLEELEQTTRAYQEIVVVIGKKMGLKLGPNTSTLWNFDPERGSFIRAK